MKNIFLLLVSVITLSGCGGGGGGSADSGGGTGGGVNNGNLGQLNSVPLNLPLIQTNCTVTGSTSQKLKVTKTNSTTLNIETMWYSADTSCSSLTGTISKLIYTISGSVPLSTDNSFDSTSLSVVSKEVSIFGVSGVNSYNSINAYGFNNWVSGAFKNITCLKLNVSDAENQRQPCAGAIVTGPIKYQNLVLTLDGVNLQ